jgi:hypothetical protein
LDAQKKEIAGIITKTKRSVRIQNLHPNLFLALLLNSKKKFKMGLSLREW